MFSKKRFVVFISKRSIDPGFITLSDPVLFDGCEAFQYTKETLATVLQKVGTLAKGKIRVVLGEELVYVTELSFPGETRITRELVLGKAQESIPEDLRKTAWDFQALHYLEKPKEEKGTLVQVVVIEKAFSENFRQALDVNPLSIEAIFPESYVLANSEKEMRGVSVIVEQDREITVICAVEDGFVIATRVENGLVIPDRLKEFLHFLSVYKDKKAERIILSHFSEPELESFRRLSLDGYEIIAKDYNPLIGAALQQKISGKDEEVLNINTFPSFAEKHWWKFF